MLVMCGCSLNYRKNHLGKVVYARSVSVRGQRILRCLELPIFLGFGLPIPIFLLPTLALSPVRSTSKIVNIETKFK